jgi:hypothetical protein
MINGNINNLSLNGFRILEGFLICLDKGLTEVKSPSNHDNTNN